MSKKRGRKSKYDSHVKPNLDKIKGLRLQGYTEEQIAKEMRVAYSTFNEYKLKYPELLEALKEGTEELILELEKSLFMIAKGGYEIKDTKTIKEDTGRLDKQGNKQYKIRVEESKKTAQPNMGALAFSLKNLSPDRWKERRDINNTIENLSDMVQIVNDLPIPTEFEDDESD